mmetsp:Transcript_7723/g.10913  ORF Transcript_7723/g.10913 Transcript_7723/m.10913 type:complete len:156 (+) Transcript_7723:713-1180(+)
MKYRMLSDDELKLLEEDLKHFLIVHGVHGEEWAKMNEEHPEEAQNLVGLFSDTVLQKVYEKLRFIEHRTQASCMVFKLMDEGIEMISINAKGDEVDLSTPEGIHEALVHQSSALTFFRNEKRYTKEREQEIHEMLEQGCVNSSEAFWMQLDKALA